MVAVLEDLAVNNHSFLHAHAASTTAEDKGGAGVFATAPIPAGAIVVSWGGWVATADAFYQLTPDRQHHALQIGDSLFLVAPEPPEPADLVNHSCAPNCGMSGDTSLIAMCDILPGEEITFDYAMCDSDPYDEFECECGTAACRGTITGSDWTLPVLQRRYRGFFSAYLARKLTPLPSWRDLNLVLALVDGVVRCHPRQLSTAIDELYVAPIDGPVAAAGEFRSVLNDLSFPSSVSGPAPVLDLPVELRDDITALVAARTFYGDQFDDLVVDPVLTIHTSSVQGFHVS
jgi:hypothetical protein